MIPELWVLGALTVIGGIVLVWLSESGRLEDYSDRRRVNKLADRSRKRKPGIRRACRWAMAGWRPEKARRAWNG